jgi:predicted ATP-dependent serine protease
MAGPKTAWRCSQCGAINEAGSRACAQCGKWPSLFDLQESVEEPDLASFEDEFDVEAYEPATFEPEPFETRPFEAQPFESAPSEPRPGEEEPEQARWKSILSGVIVPLALVLYFLIAALTDR